MFSYLARRLLQMIPLLFGITLITFFIIHLAPGKPTDELTQLNPRISSQARERLEKLYGLDKPIPVQYYEWMKRLLRLDFGFSFTDRRSVIQKIAERLPITIGINVLAMMVIITFALPIGIISAVKQYSLFDKTTTVLVFIGFATPSFWMALLLMSLFGVKLGWLPISGIFSLGAEYLPLGKKILDLLKHLILPVFVASFGGLAGFSRYIRSEMLEVIRLDYIRTARAKGLPERKVIYKHALRNALLPLITILGLSVPGLIGGSVILEQVFAIPGMGRLYWEAVMSRDYPMVMALLTIGALLTLLGNLLADLAYAWADPRIRYK